MRVVLFSFLLSTLVAQSQQLDADQLLKDAISEQQRGDYEAAIRDYRKEIELRPDDAEAKVNLGAALAHVGQFEQAIAAYRAALPLLSFKNPVLLNLGLAYYKKGDFANAHEQFEALHTAQPRDVRVAILLGDTDVRLQKPGEAVALLEPLDPNNLENADFQYVFGSALIATGRRREGGARIEKVAESGNAADVYLLAGATRLQMNDFDPARRDLEEALRLDPKLPNIYTLVGTARDKTGDAKDAETAFRDALKINPEDFEANLYLGAILYKRRALEIGRAHV